MTPEQQKKAEQEAEQSHRQRRDRLIKEVDKGADAEVALRVLDEAMSELREDALATFERSHVFDSRAHGAAKFYLNVLTDVRDRMERRVRSGETAHKKLMKLPRKPGVIRRIVNG